jgi:hypothetical protein
MLTLVRRDTTLAELALGHDTIAVRAEVAAPRMLQRVLQRAVAAISPERGEREWPSGVTSLQLIDQRRRTIYTTSFPIQQDALGRLVTAMTVTASPLMLDTEPAIFLVDAEEPHARGRGEAWQVIVPHPMGAAVATGRVANHVTRPVRAAIDAPLEALPGHRVIVDVSTGTIAVDVPLEIAPDSAAATGGVIPRPTQDPSTGLARLNVTRLSGPSFPPGSGPLHVPLYRAARGDDADTILVSPTSVVDFGDAYATITVDRDPDPGFVEEVRVGVTDLRLAATIDGRSGFVTASDFPSVGLHPIE